MNALILDLLKQVNGNKTELSVKFLKLMVRNRAKVRNRYNQAPHLNQDTNGKEATIVESSRR